MTNFKCRKCAHFWQEGPTRDHRIDQLCRICLEDKFNEVLSDAVRAQKEDTDEAYRRAISTIYCTSVDAVAERI